MSLPQGTTAQAKSKNDKNISGLLNQVEAGKIAVHTFMNASPYTIGTTDTEIAMIKEREGERILKNIREDGYVIALAIDGKLLDSVELSQKIEKLGLGGTSHIYFVIGGSLGLSDSVLRKADYQLSFSRMTFPHQLMRVVLLEQIYRSYRIMNHEPYHK